MARWKLGPQGAYFDPNDSGPDQVTPPPSAQPQSGGSAQPSAPADPWADFNKQWQQDSQNNPYAHDWNWRMGTTEYQAQHPEGPGSIFGDQHLMNQPGPFTALSGGISGIGLAPTTLNRALQEPGKIDSLNNLYQQRAGLLQGTANSGYMPSSNGAFSALMSRTLAPFGVKR